MNALVLALYAEGRTDERFLPILIQRTAEQILTRRGQQVVDVPDPIVLGDSIRRRRLGRADRILEAARRAHGFHALIIHADADHPRPDRAMRERIEPGMDLVRQSKQPVCAQLVPMIPVQMTEAWMLTDAPALCQVVGVDVQRDVLALPEHPRQVESDPDPKNTLYRTVENALVHRPRRRRRMDMGTVYEPLARQLNLDRLSSVPSYMRFVGDLTALLVALHMAQ